MEQRIASLAAMPKTNQLEVLLAAWAKTPAVELADLIDQASAIARTSPAVRGKTKVAKALWDATARAGLAADVPALLEALADVSAGEAMYRIASRRTRRSTPGSVMAGASCSSIRRAR